MVGAIHKFNGGIVECFIPKGRARFDSMVAGATSHCQCGQPA